MIVNILDAPANGHMYWLAQVSPLKNDDTAITYCFNKTIEKPTKEDIADARCKLVGELCDVKPDLIVCYGSVVAKVLLQKSKPLRDLRNRYFTEFGHDNIICTYSPLMAFAKPSILSSISEDISWGLTSNKTDKAEVNYSDLSDISHVSGIYFDGPLAYDIENIGGLSPFRHGAKFLCFSISSAPGAAQGFWHKIPTHVQANPVVGHSLKYDVLWTEAKGGKVVGPLFDTKVGTSLLDENMPDNSLKHMAAIHTDMGHYEDNIDNAHLELYPREQVLEYNMRDADSTRRLHDYIKTQLAEQGLTKLFDFLMEVERVLINMELRGIWIDNEKLQSLDKNLTSLLLSEEELLHLGASKTYNVNSHEQVGAVLYDKFDLPVLALTKKGKRSTNAQTVRALLREKLNRFQRQYLNIYKNYKRNSKIKSTYIDGFKEFTEYDGKIHTMFNLGRGSGIHGDAGTVTGRLSSSNPNLQNIPRDGRIKELFVASPDTNLWWADYSQLELRVVAWLSNDQALLDIFGTDIDPFCLQLGLMYGKNAKDIQDIIFDKKHKEHEAWKNLRTAVKTVSYGVLYGIGPNKLAYNLTDMGVSMSPDMAYQFRKDWLNKFGGVKRWIYRTQEEVINFGKVVTATGMARRLPGASLDNPVGKRLLRQGVNFKVQSLASHITLAALLICEKAITNPLLTVHDSILGETELSEPTIKDIVENIMVKEVKEYLHKTFGFYITVPLKIEFGYGKSWE